MDLIWYIGAWMCAIHMLIVVLLLISGAINFIRIKIEGAVENLKQSRQKIKNKVK
jgi:HAMP domain-containing protein